jgi:hypothetical protein
MADVGFLEIETHSQYLQDMCEIALHGKNDVTIYTHKGIKSKIDKNIDGCADIDWKVQGDKSTRRFLSQVESDTDRLDILCVNTINLHITNLYSFSKFTPDCVSLLWVHNTNNWFDSRYSLSKAVRGNLALYLKNRVLRNFDQFLFESNSLKEHASVQLSTDRPCHTFVPLYYSPSKIDALDGDSPLSLVTPGIIAPFRRDYDLLLDTFEDTSPDEAIRLTLLGSPKGEYGERIQKRCAELSSDGYDIHWFDGWVSHEAFHNRMREADAIVSPIATEYDNKRWETESYGTTKCTGNVHDALRFAKPILLPDHYGKSSELGDAALYYDGREELRRQMTKLLDPDTLTAYSERAIEQSEGFTLKKQTRLFNNLLGDILSN